MFTESGILAPVSYCLIAGNEIPVNELTAICVKPFSFLNAFSLDETIAGSANLFILNSFLVNKCMLGKVIYSKLFTIQVNNASDFINHFDSDLT